jgi:membrane associated rhomboid family serine protease
MPVDLPPVTRNLLIANVAVFFLQYVAGEFLLLHFALWPLGSGLFAAWQIVTSAFMHGGLTHIAFNMFALYMFGGTIERTFGAREFTVYYFTCAIVASLLQLFVILYAAAELAMGVTGIEPGVAHFAHLGGMLGGLVLIQYWRGRLPWKPRRRLLR